MPSRVLHHSTAAFLAFGLAIICLATSACVSNTDYKGVKNRWRDPATSEFTAGETTQQEVLAQLGPPSQLIALDQYVVFYYLLEKTATQGIVLIVYNQTNKTVEYDRAIFFFDKQGVLTDFSLSDEALPHDR